MKRFDTFIQYKPRHTIIFMEVLEVEEVTEWREICKVRWFLLDKKGLNVQSNFRMCTADGKFANFVLLPRRAFLEAVRLMKQMDKEQKLLKADSTDDTGDMAIRLLYVNTRRKVVRIINANENL